MSISARPPIGLHHVAGECYPRYNVKSTLVPCPDTDYVFLYGGFDENDNLDSNVYLFNVKSRVWEVDSAHHGLYREGHLALYLGDGNVFVFGGVPYDEVPELDPLADDLKLRKDLLMLMYSVYKRTWVSAPAMFLANAPSGRSRHACCLSDDGRTIYLSGGLINSAPLADLYCYDLSSGTWLGPVEFVARFDHKIAVHDGKLYSFGGLDGDMNHVTNKVTFMNLADQSVVEVLMKDGPKKKKKTNRTLLSPKSDFFGGPIIVQDCTVHSSDKPVEDEPEVLPATFEKIWLDSGDPLIKLEVSVLLWGCENHTNNISVSMTNLYTFSRLSLLTQRDLEVYFRRTFELDPDSVEMMQQYQWRNSFTLNDRLYLLGHSRQESLSSGLAYLLGTIFEVDLTHLGISTQSSNEEDALVSDLRKSFLSAEYTDYEILAFKDQESKDRYSRGEAGTESDLLQDPLFVSEYLVPIRVHKAILLSRWPHFRRIMDSGMSETHSGQLFVPEPYSPVRALLFYLYTGTVDFSGYMSPALTTVEYSELLILSNLYELSSLRSKVLYILFKLLSSDEFEITDLNNIEKTEHTIGSMLRIWENSLILNEEMFMAKVEELIHDNWSVVSRSQLFISLSKVLIVKLCQDCFDRKNLAQTPTYKRELFDSPNSVTLLPAVHFRSEQSNSPFTKTFDDEFASPHDQAGLARNLSSTFPHLQNIPQNFNEF